MKQVKRRIIFVCALLSCLVCAAGALATDLTVFVVSDTHFTENKLPSKVCKAGIQAMNCLPGTAYPPELDSATVAAPSAVLVCGDLCDGGSKQTTWATDNPTCFSNRNYRDQWCGFDYCFPVGGASCDNNRLKYPVYATAGNHDWLRWCGFSLGTTQYVVNKLKYRYASFCNAAKCNVYYSFDLDGIHFACLGCYPDQCVLGWLKSDLASIGCRVPVVLFQHYDFKAKTGEKWWKNDERKSLADTINGYKIIAILHGHTHATCHYTWNGYDVYDDGTLGKKGDIGVLHITDSYVDYANYRVTCDDDGNRTGGSWQWSYRKSR